MQKNKIEIPYYRVILEITFSEPIDYHFPEALFRGALGYTLKEMVCLKKNELCDNCIFSKTCAFYSFYFSNFNETSELHLNNTSPRPYVIRYFQRSSISGRVELIFLNKISSHINYIIFAFMKMGESGIGKTKVKYTITSIIDNNSFAIYNRSTGVLTEPKEHIFSLTGKNKEFDEVESKKVYIDFIKPYKIVINNKLQKTLTFQIFIKSLLLRLSYLSQIYGYYSLEKNDLDNYIINSSKVKILQIESKYENLKRYSMQKKSLLSHMGFYGHIVYEGNINLYQDIIYAGSIFGIGKNTTFGFGTYDYVIQ